MDPKGGPKIFPTKLDLCRLGSMANSPTDSPSSYSYGPETSRSSHRFGSPPIIKPFLVGRQGSPLIALLIILLYSPGSRNELFDGIGRRAANFVP